MVCATSKGTRSTVWAESLSWLCNLSLLSRLFVVNTCIMFSKFSSLQVGKVKGEFQVSGPNEIAMSGLVFRFTWLMMQTNIIWWIVIIHKGDTHILEEIEFIFSGKTSLQQNHCCPLHLWQCQPSTGGHYFASSSPSSFWAPSHDSISCKPSTYTSEILALHCRCNEISPGGIQLPTHKLPMFATWPSSHPDIKPSSHLTIKLDIHTFSCMTISWYNTATLLYNMPIPPSQIVFLSSPSRQTNL